MSWQAQTAVNHHSRQSNLGLFRLLLYLAEQANETGRVDPAPNQETIATFFACTDRTVRNRISQLIESGELLQVRVGSGPGNPSAYQIALPMPVATDNGGKMAEVNAGFFSTIAELKAEIKAEISELKAEILTAKVEIFELKAEKVETKGGKGGNERRKTDSSESADDPLRSKEQEEEKEEESPNPLSPSFNFKPSPVRSAVKSPADERTDALLVICGLNRSVPDHLSAAESAAAQLSAYTAEYLLKRYAYQESPNGVWYWFRDDFRGEKGTQPTLKWVIETVAKERKPAASKTGQQNQSSPESTAYAAQAGGLELISPGRV